MGLKEIIVGAAVAGGLAAGALGLTTATAGANPPPRPHRECRECPPHRRPGPMAVSRSGMPAGSTGAAG